MSMGMRSNAHSVARQMLVRAAATQAAVVTVTLQVRTTTTRTTAEVYTNAVQGWRLEMGFYGLRDSLGRLYHQPPYPHFQPAADEMRTVFPTALETGINLALRGTR
jgi:hypothetical protein